MTGEVAASESPSAHKMMLEETPPFEILFVCTADRIRSPFAAALLRSKLARGARTPWRVGSSGVQAREGEPIHPVALQLGWRHGLDLSEHRSHRVTESMLTSRLVLTMTEDQRTTVVRLMPQALSRTFCLVEFVRLLQPGAVVTGGDPTAVLASAAHAAHRARALTPSAALTEDVPDPYGGSEADFQATFQWLDELTAGLVERIGI